MRWLLYLLRLMSVMGLCGITLLFFTGFQVGAWTFLISVPLVLAALFFFIEVWTTDHA